MRTDTVPSQILSLVPDKEGELVLQVASELCSVPQRVASAA